MYAVIVPQVFLNNDRYNANQLIVREENSVPIQLLMYSWAVMQHN